MSEHKGLTVAWLSAGVSSFIAAYLVKDVIDEFYYIDTDDQHADSMRFIKDCEKLLGKEIKILKSTTYKSVEEACLAGGIIRNARTGYAFCTDYLKKRVRKEQFELLHKGDEITYVWGMDCSPHERARAERVMQAQPEHNHRFPLIENELTKQDCHAMSRRLGLKRPLMYDLGYQNNNCIGCVKAVWGIGTRYAKTFPKCLRLGRNLKDD